MPMPLRAMPFMLMAAATLMLPLFDFAMPPGYAADAAADTLRKSPQREVARMRFSPHTRRHAAIAFDASLMSVCRCRLMPLDTPHTDAFRCHNDELLRHMIRHACHTR